LNTKVIVIAIAHMLIPDSRTTKNRVTSTSHHDS